jgi:polyphosphate kinase 2 (PPK2 family)
MSVLEQYTYDGSRKPDFQTLPTLVVPDEAMPADGTEASGNEGDDREIQIREQLKEKAKANLVEIGRLQKAFHAAKKRGLIVILQGMPYSGRTETNQYLKKAMKAGVKIYSYRKGECSHDFLWQMHKKTPKYGNICLMNSSVYADIPETEGGAERVRAFEKYLKASGISVVRIFLHVSSNRQKKRMLEVITTKPGGAPREMPKDKGWRKEYLEKFAEVIAAATPETPWYVIPADSKWYARCLVTEIVRDALRECVGSDEPISVEEQALAIEEMVPEIVEAEVVEAAEAVEEVAAEEPAAVEEAVAEESVETTVAIEDVAAEEPAAVEPAVTEEPAAPAAEAPAEPEKKPARRTRKKKAETETPSETETAEKKPAARRPRKQGAPKTVEETLARRRKRMGSD